MTEGGYKIRNQAAIHFLTFAVVEWVDVFTRKSYVDILLDSLRFCQSSKGLLLHAWCIMSNHVHLIASARQANLSDVLGDFKRFTSKEIIKAIEANKTESRREWMLKLFSDAGVANSRNMNYQFWRQDNRPMELYSAAFVAQKRNYIHHNPVVAGIVEKPEHYLWSSAKAYFYERQCGPLEILFI